MPDYRNVREIGRTARGGEMLPNMASQMTAGQGSMGTSRQPWADALIRLAEMAHLKASEGAQASRNAQEGETRPGFFDNVRGGLGSLTAGAASGAPMGRGMFNPESIGALIRMLRGGQQEGGGASVTENAGQAKNMMSKAKRPTSARPTRMP